MPDDVLLTNIKLEGADQVQEDLKKIGEEGARAFNRLSEAANQRFDQVSNALAKVATSLDKVANTRVEINTDRANQALENIARVTDQLSRQLANLGQPGARSLQEFNATAQQSQQQVKVLETTTVSAFQNISQTGVSAFTILKDTINDGIRTAQNYKLAIAGIFTGGAIGFVVKQIQDAVNDFNELKKAASSSGIKFDEYQKLNFILRDMGVNAKDATDLLGKMGQRAKDLKDVAGDGKFIEVRGGATRKLFPVDDEGRVGRASIIEDTKKLAELNAKLASGGFGDPSSFEAIHKYRLEVDAMRASMLAAERSSGRIITIPDAGARKLDDAIKGFNIAPTTENLKKLVDQVNNLGDSAKRVEAFKRAFGGSEEAAKALEKSLDTETIDQYIERQQKLQRLRDSDAKSTETLEAANKKLNAALFEVGFASEQGRISLGLIFAPALAPAIDVIAEGIRSLNLNFRELGNTVGKDIGPAIEQIFNIFKGVDVDTSKTGMFKGFIDGLKAAVDFVKPILREITDAVGAFFTFLGEQGAGLSASGIGEFFAGFIRDAVNGFKLLTAAAEPALALVNEFFGTNISLGDVGLVAILTQIGGGFTAIGLLAAAAFGQSSETIDKFKENLKGIGVNIDEILRKAKVFGEEFLKAIQGGEKGAKAGGLGSDFAASMANADEPIKDFARELVTLGEIVLGVGGAIVGLRRVLVVLGVGVGIEKLTGVFSALVPIVQSVAFAFGALFFAASAVFRSLQSIGLVLRILAFNPFVTLTAALVLLILYSKEVAAALEGIAKSFNEFLTKISGGLIPEGAINGARLFATIVTVLSAIVGVLLVNAFVNAGRALTTFTGLLTTFTGLLAAPVTWAAGTGLLLLLGKIALALTSVIQLYQDLTATGGKLGELERAQSALTKTFQQGGFGDPKSAEAIQRYREETEKLQRSIAETGKVPADFLQINKAQFQDLEKIRDLRTQIDAAEGRRAESREKLKSAPRDFGTIAEIQQADEELRKLRERLAAETAKPVAPEAAKPGTTADPNTIVPDPAKTKDVLQQNENEVKSFLDRLKEMFKGTDLGLDKLLGTGPLKTPELKPSDKFQIKIIDGIPTKVPVPVKEPVSGPPKIPELKPGPDQTIVTIGGRPYLVPKTSASDQIRPQSSLEGLPRFASLQTGTMSDAGPELPATTRDLNAADQDLLKTTRSLTTSDDDLLGVTRARTLASGDLLANTKQLAPVLTGLTGTTRTLDETKKIYDGTVNVLDSSANRLRETFDKLTAAVLKVIEELKKIKVPEGEKQPESDAQQPGAPQSGAPGFTTRTYQTPGGPVTVRTPTAQTPATGGRASTTPGPQGGAGTTVPSGTINPQTGQPFPPGTKVFPPMSNAPSEAFTAPGAINPQTGQPFPGGTMFLTPGTPTLPVAPDYPSQTLPPVPYTKEDGVQIYRVPPKIGGQPGQPRLTPQETPIPSTPPSTTPQQTAPPVVVPVVPRLVKPEETPQSRGILEQIIQPEDPILIPVQPEPLPLETPPTIPKEFQPVPPPPPTPPEPKVVPDPNDLIGGLTDNLVQLAAAIQPLDPKINGTTRAFDELGNEITDFSKFPKEVQEAIERMRKELEFRSFRIPETGPGSVPDDLQRIPTAPPTETEQPEFLPEQLPEFPGGGGLFDPVLGEQLNASLQQLAPAIESATSAAQQAPSAFEQVTAAFEQFAQFPATVQSAMAEIESALDFSPITAEVEQFVQQVNQTFDQLDAPSSGLGAATGGLIRGPGTDTSDSIPILASANEFMIRAKAVRHYGKSFMYAVNNLQFPHFAMGGLIDNLSSPLSGNIRLPRYADGGPVQGGGDGQVPVHVNFEGRRVFSGSAQRSSIEQLKRESLLSKVRSGGPSPFWVD